MNVEINKEVFFKVFGSIGRNSWTNTYKEKYIFKLQKEYELTSKVLPMNIIRNNTNVSKIYTEIIKHDTDLSIFLSFHKSYETLAKKTIELYNLKLKKNEVSYINDELELLAYNNNRSDEWELFEIEKENSKLTILVGKTAYQTKNIELPEDRLSSELWSMIKDSALQMTHNSFNNLVKIKTSLSEERRLVSKVVFDTLENTLEIGIDNSYNHEDGTNITNKEQSENKRQIMDQISEKLDLNEDSKHKIQESLETKENSLFTEDVFQKLNDLRDENLIIIPKLRDYYKQDEEIEEYNEHLRVEQKNQRIEDIKNNINEYYSNHGTLIGFFTDFPQHDTKEAEITNQFNSDNDINSTHYHAFAILVRDASIYEKSKGERLMTDKVLDTISFDFDLRKKEIDIKNNSYSKEIYEAIISKVLEFNKA